jgi:hypothetical protein
MFQVMLMQAEWIAVVGFIEALSEEQGEDDYRKEWCAESKQSIQ